MVLDEIQIDDEGFCFDFLPGLEASFGVTFPRDLMHLHTAGDLFDEIMKRRTPSSDGERCDTAMSFYLLRRSLVAYGLDSRAPPSTLLSGQNFGSPRKMREILTREIGLELPQASMSWPGCVLLIALFLAVPILLVNAFFLPALVAAIGLVVIARRDSGQYSGHWRTLGSLARATAMRNVMQLSVRGARSRQEDWWRAFIALLIDAGCPMTEGRFVQSQEIGRQTRFKFT